MADEEEGSGIDSEWNTPSRLHPPKKRSLCRASKKPCIKRRRFSTRPSSDEEPETGDESDYSRCIPSQTHHISNPQLPSCLTSLRSDTSDDRAMDLAGGRSRMAVIYEQQSWEGEIVQERHVKQGRGRPRKQYLIQWKQSWVDGGRLTAPELLQSWREKKASKNRH